MKPWYKSLTIWVNLVILVLTFVGDVSKLIPEIASVAGYAAALLNIVLRFKTAVAITQK